MIKRIKMFVLKHWVFLEDIWNFNKWRCLSDDAMDSNTKENYNFAIKVISTENVVKNVKEVRRKNQTFLFQVSNLGD